MQNKLKEQERILEKNIQIKDDKLRKQELIRLKSEIFKKLEFLKNS